MQTSDPQEWLREHYIFVPSDGPAAKRNSVTYGKNLRQSSRTRPSAAGAFQKNSKLFFLMLRANQLENRDRSIFLDWKRPEKCG
jgi:hypothetical protein